MSQVRPTLDRKNKFLREIDAAPGSTGTRLVLKWSLSEKAFSTADFHPAKTHYRLGVEELLRVYLAKKGLAVSKVDTKLLCICKLALANPHSYTSICDSDIPDL